MSKTKYSVPTEFGTVTRTSARDYTHVIVGNGVIKEAVTRRRYAADLAYHQENVANQEAEIAAGYPKAREFTHINSAEWIEITDKSLAESRQFIAEYESRLAQALENRVKGGLVVLGFASRLDLAQKVASRWDAEEHEEVRVVQIEEAHKAAIQSRSKKAAS